MDLAGADAFLLRFHEIPAPAQPSEGRHGALCLHSTQVCIQYSSIPMRCKLLFTVIGRSNERSDIVGEQPDR